MSKHYRFLLSIIVVLLVFLSLAGVAAAAASKTGTVTAEILNLRQSPSTTAKILKKLTKGKQVTVLSSSSGWYQVTVEGSTGWVRNDLITLDTDIAPAEQASTATKEAVTPKGSQAPDTQQVAADAQAFADSTVNSTSVAIATTPAAVTTQSVSPDAIVLSQDITGSSIVSNAGFCLDDLISFSKTLLGTPYVYGGMSPAGFDCSGFTSYVFAHFGVRLERSSIDQAKQGIEVAKDALMPGNLVFFDSTGGRATVNHAGIYIGEGKFIHASSGSSTYYVVISDLTAGYYSNNFMTARNVLDYK